MSKYRFKAGYRETSIGEALILGLACPMGEVSDKDARRARFNRRKGNRAR